MVVALLLVLPTLRDSEAQDTYQIQVSWSAKSWTHPGGTFTAVNTFRNKGTLPLRVVSVVWSTDFGTFKATAGLPLVIAVGEKKEVDIGIQVPPTASVGKHPVSLSSSYQYQDPSTFQWTSASNSPVEDDYEITVLQAHPPEWLNWLPLVGGVLALVLIIGLVIGRRWYGGPMVALPR